jgi:transcriptional regulator with XRE-family HTH domain
MAKAGLGQLDLADAVHVSQQTVSKWLKGKAKPKASRLPAIEHALHVKPGALLQHLPEPGGQEMAKRPPRQRNGVSLNLLLARMDRLEQAMAEVLEELRRRQR